MRANAPRRPWRSVPSRGRGFGRRASGISTGTWRCRSWRCWPPWSRGGSWSTKGVSGRCRGSSSVSCPGRRRRSTGWPGSASTSTRPGSCRSFSSTGSSSRRDGRSRRATPPTWTPSRRSPGRTSCLPRSSRTAASRSSSRPTSTPCPRWCTRRRGGSTPPTTRPSRPRDASRAATPTSRTSPSARPRAGASARPLSPRRAPCWCRPTTHRSSCTCSPISRATRP